MNAQPMVSIVIPVKNGEATIAKCIDSLFALNYPDYEVILIDDGSTDRTAEIVRERISRYGGARLTLLAGTEGPSAARNRGVANAKGEFIAFTDGDCIVDREWLNELFKGFGNGVAGTGGMQKSPADDTPFGKTVHDFMAGVGFITGYMKGPAGGAIRTVDHNPTCNALYRKEVLVRTGGFLEALWPGEDVELDYRITKAGLRLTFAPRAVVYHYRPATLGRFRRMMFNYGRVQAFLVKKYGFFRGIQLVPVLSYPAAVLLLLSLFWNIWILPAALLYGLMIGTCYFCLKGTGFARAVRYTLLAAVTLLEWNRGFGCGVFKRS